jgi:hypothetical protein
LGKFPNLRVTAGLQLERNSDAVSVIDKPWSDRRAPRFNSSPACSSSSPCVWEPRPSGHHRRLSQRRSRHAASAERVSQALEALYWRELLLRGNRTREHLVPVSDWRTIETMKLISPGICVRFEPVGAFEKPLCGQSKGIGAAPPWWFAAAVQTVFGTHAAVARSISTRSDTAGTVSAMADPDAAISLAWQHIVDNIHVALLMALAIAFFASLAIAHTLAPAQQIVAALQRMAQASTGRRSRVSDRWNLP